MTKRSPSQVALFECRLQTLRHNSDQCVPASHAIAAAQTLQMHCGGTGITLLSQKKKETKDLPTNLLSARRSLEFPPSHLVAALA
jgi:hypothetical protein